MKKKIPKIIESFQLPSELIEEDLLELRNFFIRNSDTKKYKIFLDFEFNKYESYIYEEESDEVYNKRLAAERVTNKMMLQTAKKQIEYYINKIKELEDEEKNTNS